MHRWAATVGEATIPTATDVFFGRVVEQPQVSPRSRLGSPVTFLPDVRCRVEMMEVLRGNATGAVVVEELGDVVHECPPDPALAPLRKGEVALFVTLINPPTRTWGRPPPTAIIPCTASSPTRTAGSARATRPRDGSWSSAPGACWPPPAPAWRRRDTNPRRGFAAGARDPPATGAERCAEEARSCDVPFHSRSTDKLLTNSNSWSMIAIKRHVRDRARAWAAPHRPRDRSPETQNPSANLGHDEPLPVTE